MPHLFYHDGESHGIHLSALAAGKGLHDDMLGAVDDDLRGLHLAHPLVVQDTALGTQNLRNGGRDLGCNVMRSGMRFLQSWLLLPAVLTVFTYRRRRVEEYLIS